jgi:EAL domain-containing protein (putative c-di-GMP-specific phosphodiesterase class I)
VLNVNVSARELREPGFADEVLAILAAEGVAPHRLAVEVTETSVLELGPSVENLRRLRERGVRISLDDFGTGHSTLSLLHDCPVDELKLDRSFTSGPDGDRPPVAAAVLQLARTMGLDVVAEGVETAAQATWLRDLGYELAQGYHFGRPVPPAELAAMLGQGVPA